MQFLASLATLLSLKATLAAPVADASAFTDCQKIRNAPSCDWIVVGKDQPSAQFSTIQGAIDSLPNNTTPYRILVLSGNYTEQLNVTRPGPVWLFGQTDHPDDQTKNTVTVYWSSANGAGSGFNDNAYTSVLTVAPTWNASLVGSGPTGFPVPEDTPFGNLDFRVYNIDFRNIFSQQSAGPSMALSVSRANAGFYQSGFYSYQDTIFIGKLGNAFFFGSDLAGQTDFLYGFGTAWIEKSNVTLRGCGGGITAWKGANTTFTNRYGVYIANSVVRPENDTIAANNVGKCALGRPWNSLHRSVFQNTYLSDVVLPGGYTGWGTNYHANETLMAEYRDYGPGFNLTSRQNSDVTTLLDSAGVGPYHCPQLVFTDQNGKCSDYKWIDRRFLPTC
ncbi:pectin methyl esterase [Thozetella sp. PMI_491]|nr:pectin methyl esterase [Thozetella sp. PMI_491]